MSTRLSITPRTLHFKQPAGTSRGVYTTRQSWFVTATDDARPGVQGVGECAPLPDLSCDASPEYEERLHELCRIVEQQGDICYDALRPYPSVLFGIETALLDLERGGTGVLFDNRFARGETGIPINGLVWMGNYEEMLQRLEEKMRAGFRCVKLKIGAIDFDRELDLVRHIRSAFTKEQIELRVDANGGFTADCALQRLEQLAQYDIHSIEQPIRQHQWAEMAALCKATPIPIALDRGAYRRKRPGREGATARHYPSAVHHPEAVAARRNARIARMDCTCRRTWHRFVDNECAGEQRGSERNSSVRRGCLRRRHNHAARTGHRAALYRQHSDAARDSRRPLVANRQAIRLLIASNGFPTASLRNKSVGEKICHISQHRRNSHVMSKIKAGRYPAKRDIFQPIFQFLYSHFPAKPERWLYFFLDCFIFIAEKTASNSAISCESNTV